MILRNHGMTVDVAWALDRPILHILVFKATLVADELLHFIVFVGAGGYTQNVISLCPENNLTGTFWAGAVRIQGVCEPHAALKAECLVGQCAYRAHVDHVA